MEFFFKKSFGLHDIKGKRKRLSKKFVNRIFSSDPHWIISCGMVLYKAQSVCILSMQRKYDLKKVITRQLLALMKLLSTYK